MASLTTCGATTLKGTKCTRAAGWGTDHKGEGHCSNHDGTKDKGSLKQSWLTFADEYLKCGNATASYKVAYPDVTDETAASNGYKLLRNAEISAYLNDRWQSNAASTDELINLQSNIARADMSEFAELPDYIKGDPKLIKKYKHTRRNIQYKDGGGEIIDTYELELLDPQKAQVDLLKLHGKFNHTIKHEHSWRDDIISGLLDGTIQPEAVTAELGDDLAAELFKAAGVKVD